MKRIWKISLASLAVLIATTWLGVYLYLHSDHVHRYVTGQVAARYGGPVTIDQVDIGLFSTTMRGVRLYEPGRDATTGTPLVTARAITLDVPLWDLAFGIIDPSAVNIDGAEVQVRFDDAGHLLTRLPEQLLSSHKQIPWNRVPKVSIEQSQLLLQKGNHQPLTVHNIEATLMPTPGRLLLAGSAESAFGNLAVNATVDESSQVAQADVKTDGTARITQNLLERLPLVPAALLDELQVESANAAGTLAVSYDLPKKALHYRIDIDTSSAKIYLPGLGMAVQHGSAAVNINDDVIRLKHASGHALGGTVHAQGKLTVDGPIIRLTLSELKAENLNAADVPETWGIPPMVRKSISGGKVFGEAKLELTLGEQIHIKSQGKGEVRDPAGKSGPIEFDWQLAPALHARHHAKPTGNALALFTTFILLDGPPAQDGQPKPAGPSDYSDLKFNLKNASLAELVKNEGLKLPFPLDGKISFQVKASFPIDRLRNLKTYKAHGSAQVDRFLLGGLKFDEVTTDFDLADGVLNLKSLKSVFADNAGKPGAPAISGSGRIEIAPLGEVSADLSVAQIPLGKLLEQSSDDVQGTVSASLAVRGNLEKLTSAKGLTAEGKISSSPIKIYGVAVSDFGSALKLKDGALTFPGLQARVDGQLFAPTASVQLKDDDSIVAKIALHDRELAAIRTIALAKKIPMPPVTGTISAEAVAFAKSTPSKPRPTISGDIEAKNLKVESADIEEVRVHWELDGRKINLNADLYDGKMIGSALLPKPGQPAGLDVKVQELNLRRLAKDLRMPFAVDGRVDGTLKATVTPAAKDQESKAEVEVDFKSPMLRVQNLPAEQLKGLFRYQAGKVEYSLTGKSLGGSFDLQGEIPGGAAGKEKAEKAKQGRLQIKNVRIGELLGALGAPVDGGMGGTINLDVPFTQDTPDRFPQGKGTFRISDVRWRDTIVSDNIQAEIVLADQELRVRRLEGDLADGTIDGQAIVNLRDPNRSEFTLNLDGIQSGTLLAPWIEKKIEGRLQARFRGRLGRTSSGTATIEMARGKVAGLEFTDWRMPINWTFAPGTGRAKAEIYDTSAQIASGRAAGKLNLGWEDGGRIDGQLRLERVELGDLLKNLIGSSSLGAGRTTAKLDIKGTRVRSLADINGNLTASFEQAQALQVPVLQQIAPFLRLGASTTFQRGSIVANIDHGTANIKQLTLQGNGVQLFIDGTVTPKEQLNLHVVAKTGDIGWPTLRLGPIGVRIPIAGPVPLVLAQEVSALISNHVVYLDVTGTPKSPVIRSEPLRTLTSEAVRFFLNPANSPITLNP